MELIEMLFKENTEINKALFSKSLYSSYNKSYLKLNDEFLSKIKIYENIIIIKKCIDVIGDLKNELEIKYIINCDDNLFFVRLLQDDLKIIYDVLIYDINKDELEKYEKIFFSKKEIELDDYLKGENNLIAILRNNHLEIIKGEDDLLKMIKYESWDFSNKHNNCLECAFYNSSLMKKINEKKCFLEAVTFICNGDELKDININFKYYNYINDFYILEIVK